MPLALRLSGNPLEFGSTTPKRSNKDIVRIHQKLQITNDHRHCVTRQDTSSISSETLQVTARRSVQTRERELCSKIYIKIYVCSIS